MTLSAIVTEGPRNVVRIGRVGEIRLVALIAVRVHKLIVPVHVTCLTLHSDVSPRQREARCTVIKRGTGPIRR